MLLISKIKTLGIFFITLLILNSCSDFKTEIWINKKGKGKMEMEFDPATFFPKDPLSSSLMADTSKTQKESKFDMAMERVFKDGNIQHFDTSFQDVENKNFFYHFHGDTITRTSFVKITVEFKNAKEYNELFNPSNLTTEWNKEILGKGQEFIFSGNFNKKKKSIKLPIMSFDKDLVNSLAGKEFSGNEDQKILLKTFLGNSVTTVHLPKKVVRTNDPKAEIYGDIVVFRRSFFDMLDGKWTQREIEFK